MDHNLTNRVRIKTAKDIQKSKTTVELARPFSVRRKEIYTVSKLLPKKIIQEKEILYEENMKLKLHTHDILSENLQLRTRLKQLENKRKKHEESDPSLSLISGIKREIKDLKEKLEERDQEIASLKKNIKICKLEELEIELKTYQEECSRLTAHLNEFMKAKDIPNTFLDYENRLFSKNQVIAKLKKEAQEIQADLSKSREEAHFYKDKNSLLEKKTRKTSPKPTEVSHLREDLETTKNILKKLQAEHEEKEKKNLSEVYLIRELYESELLKSRGFEKKLEEKDKEIENLKRKIFFLNSESLKSNDSPHSFSLNQFSKQKHPPRVFVKINEIIREKRMIISVFLSLLDKNNNGFVESEELRKKINVRGKPTKIKHIEALQKTIGVSGKKIPITLLEEWFEKFEYPQSYFSSSDEEVIEQPKKPIEKLFSSKVKPNSNIGEIIIPEVQPLPSLPKFKEKEIELVKTEEISDVLERIKLHMVDNYVLRTRFLTVLFGNNFNPDEAVEAQEIEEVLIKCEVYLGETEDVKLFAKFLVEPEGTSLPVAKYAKLKGKVLEFGKKLQKSIKEWSLVDKHKAHIEVYSPIMAKKNEIIEEIKKIDSNEDKVVSKQDFNKIVYRHTGCSVESLEYLYLLSYRKSRKIERIVYDVMFEELEKDRVRIIGLKKKHERVLRLIQSEMIKKYRVFNEVFAYDKEFLVSMDMVTDYLRSLEIGPDDQLLKDLNIGRYICDLGLLKAMICVIDDDYE